MSQAHTTARRGVARIAAAALVAFAMVVGGAAPAAFAVPRTITLTFEDEYGVMPGFLVSVDGLYHGLDENGQLELALEPGTHSTNIFHSFYTITGVAFTVLDTEDPQAQTITFTRHASVMGTVPVGASSNLSIVPYQWNGTAWSSTGSTFINTLVDGSFEIPLPSGPGIYTLYFNVDSESGYFDSYLGPRTTLPESEAVTGATFTVDAVGERVQLDDVTLFEESTITGTVFDAISFEPLEGVTVFASAPGAGTVSTGTDADGEFSLTVHPGYEYTIWAEADGWFTTYYDGYIFEDDADLVTVPNGGTIDLEIDIVPELTAIFGFIDDYTGPDPDSVTDGTGLDPDDLSPLAGATAHLFHKVGAEWLEVDTLSLDEVNDTSDPDTLTSYAFPSAVADTSDYSEIEWLEPGDYRLFFSNADGWVPVLYWATFHANLSSGDMGGEAESDGAGCYIDAPGVMGGQLWITAAIGHSAAAGDECDPATANAEAPTPTPTPKPKPKPKPAPFTGGSSGDSNASGADTETDEAEGDETGEGEGPAVVQPTSPPAPTASPTPDPTSEGDARGDGLDFTWLWWVGGILLLIIIAGGTMIIVRRP